MKISALFLIACVSAHKLSTTKDKDCAPVVTSTTTYHTPVVYPYPSVYHPYVAPAVVSPVVVSPYASAYVPLWMDKKNGKKGEEKKITEAPPAKK